MVRHPNGSQQNMVEKLTVLNDRGLGMFTRLYSIKKQSSDHKFRPTIPSDKGSSPSPPSEIKLLRPLTICGIKNHGNTCFMNAILQCLSQTDRLAEYFVMSQYKHDLVKHHQLNSSCKYGSQGEVTSQCALLFKSLWTNTYTSEISHRLKHLLSKHCKQYEGNDQHDAQEFLFILLDIFHEDLNTAVNNKRKPTITSSKKLKPTSKHAYPSDERVAAETLAYHTRCDSSFIHDLFQAQLCSTLVCRSCNNYSNTFDPYMCLSLPVPIKRTHTIIINVSYLDNLTKLVRMVVTIEAQATLREVRDKISRLVKIPERQLVLLVKEREIGLKELIKDKLTMHEILDDMDDIELEAIETSVAPTWGPEIYSTLLRGSTALSPMAMTTAFGSSSSSSSSSLSSSPSPPSHSSTSEVPLITSSSSPLPPSSQPLTLLWINRVGIGTDNKVFGPFFSSTLPRESSFKEIQHELMKTMSPILRKTCDLKIVKDSTLFRLKVIDGLPGKCYLPEDVDHPLFMPTVDKALSHCEEDHYRGPLHLKLIVEWDLDLRQTLLVDDEDVLTVIDDPNIETVRLHNELSNMATLKDCFEMYFKEERLGADNAWMCPACRRRQQCIKKLSLWSTPDVFIIHLKRFRQASNASRTKLSTMVTFPLSGLNMNPYLSDRTNVSGDTDKIDLVNNNNYSNYKNNHNLHHRHYSSSTYLPTPWRKPSSQGNNNNINNHINHNYANYQGEYNNSPRPEENIYNLYAVCNHHGNMQAGHYTAYCRNRLDSKWYSFDDQNVNPVPEGSVVTSDAYILFYQRSTLSLSSSTETTSSAAVTAPTSRASKTSTSSSPSSTASSLSSTSSSASSNGIISTSSKPIDHGSTHFSCASSTLSNRSSPSSAKSQDNLSNSPPNSDSSSHENKSEPIVTKHYNHSHHSRGVRAYSTLPSRGSSSDSPAKSSSKDARSISPPIKRSQISNHSNDSNPVDHENYGSSHGRSSDKDKPSQSTETYRSPLRRRNQSSFNSKHLSYNKPKNNSIPNGRSSSSPATAAAAAAGHQHSQKRRGMDAVDIRRSPRFRDDLFSCFVGFLS